ncbi:MAG: ABC transporter permease [Gemmatimonadales bacterium]
MGGRRTTPPWYLLLPALLSAAAVVLPLTYLVVRALGGAGELEPLLTGINARRLGNTLGLSAAVLTVVSLLAIPMAWLSVRTELFARRSLSVLAVLPLAVPGYVMAYALLSLGGDDGVLVRWLGAESWWLAPFRRPESGTLPRMSGFSGALLALSAVNLPYMYLTVRAAMRDLDPALEEAARSLGQRPSRVWFGVVAPQLLPAFLAGALLVVLHVIADFGVVSLMRFDTFSAVLYAKYNAFDAANASRVALLLLMVAGLFIAAEMLLLSRLRLDRAGSGGQRRRVRRKLGWGQAPALVLFAVVIGMTVLVPLLTVGFWMGRLGDVAIWERVFAALGDSMRASLPAAVLATAVATPIALMRARYPSPLSFIAERLPFLGYATPALAFALSLIMLFSADWMPDVLFSWFYQSLPLLVLAYLLHFLAEAVGPVRSSVYLASPRLEEASRALGRGPGATFWRVTVPVLRNGLLVSLALVFLSCMKELPLTMLLAPIGFESLAMSVWDHSENAEFARAAPFALAILLVSALFTAVLLLSGRDRVPAEAA